MIIFQSLVSIVLIGGVKVNMYFCQLDFHYKTNFNFIISAQILGFIGENFQTMAKIKLKVATHNGLFPIFSL